MSARAHGTDEPVPPDPRRRPAQESAAESAGQPDGPAEGASERPDEPSDEPLTSTVTPADTGRADAEPERAESSDAAGADPGARELQPGDVESRWSDIVTRLRDPADPRAWAPDPEVEEAEDHFVAPDPGPVLGGDPLLTMAWAAVIGAALLLVVVVVGWRDAPTWVLQVAGAAFLGGAGLLVWRMPHERDEDDDDPGAVV